jgi:hypothetical protein
VAADAGDGGSPVVDTIHFVAATFAPLLAGGNAGRGAGDTSAVAGAAAGGISGGGDGGGMGTVACPCRAAARTVADDVGAGGDAHAAVAIAT